MALLAWRRQPRTKAMVGKKPRIIKLQNLRHHDKLLNPHVLSSWLIQRGKGIYYSALGQVGCLTRLEKRIKILTGFSDKTVWKQLKFCYSKRSEIVTWVEFSFILNSSLLFFRSQPDPLNYCFHLAILPLSWNPET